MLDRAVALASRAAQAIRSFSNPINLPGFYSTSLWRVPPGKKSEDFLALYGTIGWLFAAVSKISESTAQTKWRIVHRRPSDDEGEEVAPGHPAQELLKKVNPFWTYYDLIQFTSMYMDLVGEAFWYFVRDGAGQPAMIWVLQPHRMYVVPSDNLVEFVSGYVYRSPLGMDIPLNVKDIIHFKRPNPLNMYRGLGPVQAAQYDMDTENFTAQYMRNYFFNSAAPGGFIKVPGGYDREQHERLIEMFEKRHQGAQSGGRIGILWGDMEWTAAEVTAREMQLTLIRKLNRDQILGVFGVPLSVMGITENVNRANAEAGYYVYGKEVIDPRLKRIKSVIDEFYLPMFGTDLYFEYDDPVPEDTATNRQMAVAGWASGISTHGEARSMFGHDELDEEDYYLLPFGAETTPLTGPEIGADKQPALPPPAPDDDDDDADDDADDDDKDDGKDKEPPAKSAPIVMTAPRYVQYIRVPAKKKKKLRPPPSYAFEIVDRSEYAVIEITDYHRALPSGQEERDEFGERVWQQVQGILGEQERKIAVELDDMFGDLAVEVSKRLEGMISFPKAQRAIDEILADWTSHDRRLQVILRKAGSQGFKAGVGVASSIIKVDFDLRRLQSEQWALANAAAKVKGITETTRKNLAQAVEEALRKGMTSKALGSAVQSAMKLSGSARAMSISRTELQFAANAGADRLYESEGIEKKEWYTARDERVCPICAPLHGQVVVVRGVFAGGHDNPPAHPQCRCTILPIVGAEDDQHGDAKKEGPLPDDQDPFDVGERVRHDLDVVHDELGIVGEPFKTPVSANLQKWQAHVNAVVDEMLASGMERNDVNRVREMILDWTEGGAVEGHTDLLADGLKGKPVDKERFAPLRRYYEYVQGKLAGVFGDRKTVTLYRGMAGPEWYSIVRGARADEVYEIDLDFAPPGEPSFHRTASSWTSSLEVATHFAQGRDDLVVEAVFDVSDILYTPIASPAWTKRYVTQREFVVKHGRFIKTRLVKRPGVPNRQADKKVTFVVPADQVSLHRPPRRLKDSEGE